MPIENFKSFMLTNDSATAKTPTKKKTEATYKVIGVSGCDFIVEKSTKTTTNTLVCLISQGQVFFKNKKEEVTPFTASGYLGFMSASEIDIPLIDTNGEQCTWITHLFKGKAMGVFIEAVIKDYEEKATIHTLIKKGVVRFSKESISNFSNFTKRFEKFPELIKTTLQVFRYVPPELKELFMKDMGDELVRTGYYYRGHHYGNMSYESSKAQNIVDSLFDCEDNTRNIFELIDRKWGQSGVNTFLEKYFETPVCSTPSCHRLSVLLLITDFKFETFIDYMFDSGVQQGYAANMDNFVQSWKDSLTMENDIYGKIINKYPEYLASHHQVLSYKYSILKEQIDEEKFARRVEEMSHFEYSPEKSDYIIIAPKTKEDMIEESRQQSNCLSSYVSRVIDGLCYIFFMRKKSNPDKSLVTIEVLNDGELNQVQARYNHTPTEEQINFVHKWHRTKFADFERIPL